MAKNAGSGQAIGFKEQRIGRSLIDFEGSSGFLLFLISATIYFLVIIRNTEIKAMPRRARKKGKSCQKGCCSQ